MVSQSPSPQKLAEFFIRSQRGFNSCDFGLLNENDDYSTVITMAGFEEMYSDTLIHAQGRDQKVKPAYSSCKVWGSMKEASGAIHHELLTQTSV